MITGCCLYVPAAARRRLHPVVAGRRLCPLLTAVVCRRTSPFVALHRRLPMTVRRLAAARPSAVGRRHP